MVRQRVVAVVLALIAAAGAAVLALLARGFNDEMQLEDPALAHVPPAIVDPRTPRLSQRVILVIVDGLRLDHSRQPGFDAVRAAGIDGVASSHYPTVSRPNYITLLTGAPPVASGIRANRVRTPIRIDSIMARAKQAGLRVASASDIGNIPPLFITDPVDGELGSLDHPQVGDLITPQAGYHWPFDEVRKADSLAGLETSLATVLATPSDLVVVLAGDVDRAGHATGAASSEYREASVAVGAAIGRLVPTLDLSRDTLIVTADHGHVDRGGHGGPEPEATAVPLLIAGAGIVRGAQAPTARLVDVAPTIAALLGIPAPGHGYGRALVELLTGDHTARTAADVTRLTAMRDADLGHSRVDLVTIAITCLGLIGALIFAIRSSTITLSRGVWIGTIAFGFLIAALVIACRGRMSPSEVPALFRLQRLLAVCGPSAIVLQLVASWYFVRHRANRLSLSNAIALVGIAISLGTVFLVRGYFATPRVDVPAPFWLVAIPAVELAAAVSCVAITIHLIAELIISRRGTDDHAVAR